MSTVKPCPECGGTEIYRRRWVPTGSPTGPQLLPGLGGFGYFATCDVHMCRSCGLIRLFASEEARSNLAGSDEWHPLPGEAD